MELVNAVLGPIIDITVGPVGRQIRYVYRYAENIQFLRQKVEDLSTEIVKMERKIEHARNVGRIILPKASKWQTEATSAKDDAEKFLNENPSDGPKTCLKGLCPNICSRYVVSKDAKKKTTDVARLVEEGIKLQTDTVSQPAPLPKFESRAGNPDFEAFESRKSAFNDIMHSLEDEAVRVIGIYGTGGVGKTDMADKVGAQAENDHIFDEIVKVVVTQNPVFGKIQDELAAQLNLKLEETTVVGKQIELLQRLTNGKKILLILDDVWEVLNLTEIGIPFANENTNGCKVILTTRIDDVCTKMKVNKRILIDFLSPEDAWILFRRQITHDIPRDLHEVAKQVCEECARLPLAILAIGSTLNDKPSEVWNDVLEQLRKSQLKDIPGVSKKVYASLAVSYHNLDLDEAKSCFLFCSLFPEDFNIPIEFILRYGKGVGVPKEMETLSRKRNRVHHLVHILKSHCLLLEGGDDEHVKMHDVIRDVAISIASEEGQHVFFSEIGRNLKRWPGYYATSSGNKSEIHNKSIKDCLEFPDKLDCAKLNTLILARPKYRTLEIPPTFSHSMIKLKVLVLVRMTIPEFPASIKSIVDMEVLCLEECELKDLWWVGNFKKLEILISQGSHFSILPAEVGELSHLRLLDLRDCKELRSISPGVISKLSTLQELFLPLTTNQRSLQWKLKELKDLSQLEALEMRVLPNSNLMEFPRDFGCSFWDELTIFRIFINIDYWNGDLSLKNTLNLKGVSLSGWATVLLKRVERSYASGNFDVLYDVGRGSYPKLIDKLQQFEVNACQGITEFLSVVIDVRSVSHLSVLKITCCDLEYILSPSMAKVLPQLQTLVVKHCKNLKSIVRGCQENDNEDAVILHQLEELYVEELPMLGSFYTDSGECCALQPLFTRKVGLPKLRKLSLHSVNRVKEIWAGDIPPPPNSSLCYLTRLEIGACHALVRAIPPAILPSLHRLESLAISSCNSLKEIVGGEAASGGAASSGLPKLRDISLMFLPELKNLFSVRFTCQCLSFIRIWKCGGLIKLFSSPSPALAFAPNLQNLEISECEKMEEITEFLSLAVDDRSVSQLSVMIITSCNLKCILSPSMAKALPQLRHLKVKDCENLESIVGRCQENDTEEVVIFHQLEELHLDGLPMLVSFYTDSREGCALFTRKVGLPKLKGLSLKSIGCVKDIWAGNIPPPPDSPLWHLEIMECHELVRAILPGLHRLERLTIKSCNSLREIVGSEAALGGVALGGFPKLRQICLTGLPKLEILFSSPSAAYAFAPDLQHLDIGECEKMVEIVSGGSTGKDVLPGDHASSSSSPHTLQIIFPRLKSLLLYLPNLISLCPSGYLLFPNHIRAQDINLLPNIRQAAQDINLNSTTATPVVQSEDINLEEIAG